MGQRVTEADVGKRVENHEGDQIGVAASIDETTVYVEPNPSTVDSITAALGWETDASEVVPVNEAVVGEVTPDAIRLDSELAVQGGAVGTGSGRPPDTGSEPSDDVERPPGTSDPDADPDGDDPEIEGHPDEDVDSRTATPGTTETGADVDSPTTESDAASEVDDGSDEPEAGIDTRELATEPDHRTDDESRDH